MTKLPFGHKISQVNPAWDEVCLEMILEKYPDCDQKAVENYLKFVADGKQVNGKLEGHHTLMRADFPQYIDTPVNIVKLTARNHFVAHYLLAKAVPSSSSIQITFYLMANMKRAMYLKLQEVYKMADVYEASKLHIPSTKGFTPVYNPDTKMVVLMSKTDPVVVSGQFRHHTTGTTSVRDKQRNCFRVPKDDSRIISGELQPINKGRKVRMNTVTGETASMIAGDVRLEDPNWVHPSTGKVAVVDSEGNTFSVSKNDSRFLSGELRGVMSAASEDTRKRIGNAQLGRHPSLELRKLWSKRRKGRVVSQKTRDKISASHFLMHQKRRENVI
jgi:hypothetical protein